ncbi:insulinase family protein [Acidobacteria bacterium AH-259-O06]|nr:insulinase family protein [Acidobacteria bacterium AH-259-O06]
MRWLILSFLSFVFVTSPEAETLALSQRGHRPPEYFKAFQSREDKGNLTRVVLRNGLTILIEEQSLDPLVAVVTYVRAGYSQEGKDSRGVSRLLEQLYLYRSGAALQMSNLGAVLNVSTNYDSTSFSSCSPAENVLEILELHADLLQAPEISSKEIAPEVGILLEEKRRRLQSPRVFAKQKLLNLVYPADQLGQGPFSLDESLSALKETDTARQKLALFHKAYYHPKNVILTVSGQVRRERILKKVVELYGSMRSSKGALQPSHTSSNLQSSIAKASFQYLYLRGDLQQPHILLAYRVPGVAHDHYLPLLLLSYLLGRGRGAVLQQSIIEEGGSAVDVEVKLEAFQGKGTFFFFLTPPLDKVDRAEVQVLAQLEALKHRGIPVSQLDRAKALLLKDHYKWLQSLKQRAYLLSQYEATGGYLKRDRLGELLGKISTKQVTSVLNRYFADSNLSLVEYFPQNAETRTFTSKTLLETLRLLIPTVLDQPTGEIDALQIAQNKSTFRIAEFTPSHLNYDLKRTSILRGPVIYFQEEHALPLVHIGFFFPGGRLNESAKNSGITELMLRALLRNVTSQKTSKSWSELERLGAEIKVVNELDFFGFQVSTLSSHVNEIFGTLVDWTHHPGLEEDDLKWARQEVLALLGREKQSDFSRLLDLTGLGVFKKHPYGLDRYGTTETISGVTLQSLQAWMSSLMARVHPLIVVQGDVKGTSFLQHFISTLSDPNYEIREAIERKIGEETDGSNAMPGPVFQQRRGEVMVGFAGPAKGTREEVMLDVLESALLGPSGRLSVLLRNEASLVYQFKMFHQAGLDGGAIFAYLATFDGKEEAARQELLKQLEHLTEVPLRQREFLGALVRAITRFYIRQQPGEDYVVELSRNLLAGRGVDYAQRYLSAAKNTRADDVMYLAKRYFAGREGTGDRSQETGARSQE